MNSGEIMNSTDLTLAIFSVILIIIAIFLFILLKIFVKKKENKKPESSPVNKNEPPVRSFVSLPESAKGPEKELNTGLNKEEMKLWPAMLQVEENANLKLEDTLAENEVEKTVHDVSGKKVNRNKRKSEKKTEKIDASTLNKETKPGEILTEKKPVTKAGKKKNPKKEVAKTAITEPEEKLPEKEPARKVSRKNKKPTKVIKVTNITEKPTNVIEKAIKATDVTEKPTN